ncbi:MAG: acyl-CoA thioesterase [Sphingomonadales bacterium]|nr:acyl-CoA thioesterase [Sphingomonadales bacterium]MBK9005084.1 acyl-CoA thioesterase [Sphingomonadales bacterium]MBK9267183.1 acyl-CoA thioesterase [Sphingomonadales bacterium]MBP6433475.1 acyl-CoA thioesterase [Sphingorhabdus sp.]
MSAPFTLPFTATPEDIDELGHVNNAVWVRWIQDMATAHWAVTADPAHVDAYIWVVTRHEIDYRGNVALGDSVTGRTWIEKPPRGATFDRRVEFVNGAGKVIVSANTTWAMLDRASGRLIRVPAEVAAPFLGRDQAG